MDSFSPMALTSTPVASINMEAIAGERVLAVRKRKRLSSRELLERPELTDTEYSIIVLIEEKMRLLDKLDKLDILDTLQTEMRDLKETICALKCDNEELRKGYQRMEKEVTYLKKENESLHETVTDLQYRQMSDNLIITGIPEALNEDPEKQVKTFFQKELQLPDEEIKNIILTRVHRLGKKRTFANVAASPRNYSRPIIIKFSSSKQRYWIKSLGPRLKGKPFGISEQFPRVIMERRKVLLPLYYQERKNGKKS